MPRSRARASSSPPTSPRRSATARPRSCIPRISTAFRHAAAGCARAARSRGRSAGRGRCRLSELPAFGVGRWSGAGDVACFSAKYFWGPNGGGFVAGRAAVVADVAALDFTGYESGAGARSGAPGSSIARRSRPRWRRWRRGRWSTTRPACRATPTGRGARGALRGAGGRRARRCGSSRSTSGSSPAGRSTRCSWRGARRRTSRPRSPRAIRACARWSPKTPSCSAPKPCGGRGGRDRACFGGDVATMISNLAGGPAFAAMDHSDVCPLTLCYLTVPRDPQSIVAVPDHVAPRAHRVATRSDTVRSAPRPVRERPQVRARTRAATSVSAPRLTGSRSGS